MKKEFFLVIIFIFCLLQVTILDYFKVFQVKPDLLFISVVIASLFFSGKWAILFSLLSGVLKDVFTIDTFGINTLLFTLESFFVIRLSKKITLDENFLYAAVIFAAVIINAIIIRVASIFFGDSVVSPGIFLRIAFFQAIYTALISPLLFKLAK